MWLFDLTYSIGSSGTLGSKADAFIARGNGLTFRRPIGFLVARLQVLRRTDVLPVERT